MFLMSAVRRCLDYLRRHWQCCHSEDRSMFSISFLLNTTKYCNYVPSSIGV